MSNVSNVSNVTYIALNKTSESGSLNENKFTNALSSTENTHEKMSTPASKGPKKLLARFLNFFKKQPQRKNEPAVKLNTLVTEKYSLNSTVKTRTDIEGKHVKTSKNGPTHNDTKTTQMKAATLKSEEMTMEDKNNLKNEIINTLNHVKEYRLEILKTGRTHNVAQRKVSNELTNPTTPRGEAERLISCAEKAMKINDADLLEKCDKLFFEVLSHQLAKVYNPDVKQNVNLWDMDKRVTDTQIAKMYHIVTHP